MSWKTNRSKKEGNNKIRQITNVNIYTILITFALIGFIVLIAIGSDQVDKNRVFVPSYKTAADVEVLGTDWYDANLSQAYAYPKSINSIRNNNEEVSIYRYLPHEIKANDRLLIKTSVAEVRILVDENQIYSYSAELTQNERTVQKTWHSVLLKPEWANKKLTIEINVLDALDTFVIMRAYFGNDYSLRDYMFIHDSVSFFLAACLVFLGLSLILTHIVSSITTKMVSEMIWFGGLLISVGVWGISSRDFVQASLPCSWIWHMLYVGSFLAIPMFYFMFIKRTTIGRFEKLINIGVLASIIWSFIGILMIIFGYQNYALFVPVTIIILFYGIVIHIFRSFVTYSNNGYIRRFVSFYVFSLLLLFSAVVYEGWCYYIFGSIPSPVIFIATFIFALIFMTIDSVEISAKNREEKILATKLTNQLVATAFSQIKPHFLYNTLTSIKSLIRSNPTEAYEMISDFSDYLRSNFDAMNQRGLIPIEEELEHIRIYVKIEKKRFGDRVHYIIDNRANNFSIPALSIQPLVENAIKHGVCKKVEGGTVVLRIYETPFNYCVEVKDDGIGFEVQNNSEKKEAGGLENAIYRLKNMLHAEVTVSSGNQLGTKILIKIPKAERDMEL